MNNRKRININISGRRFEVLQTTLANLPDSFLAQLDENSDEFDRTRNEFYFDRDPSAFECVLNYYRTKELHVPLSVCGSLLKKELKFWGISHSNIERCCWSHFTSFETQKASLLRFEKLSNYFETCSNRKDSSKFGRWMDAAWRFFENPKSSIAALVYSIFSLCMILLSITILVISTMPLLRNKMTKEDWAEYHGVSTNDIQDDDPDYWNNYFDTSPTDNATSALSDNNDTKKKFHIDHDMKRIPEAFIVINKFCAAFFTLEIILRFVVSRKKRRFVTDGFNIVDIICIVPMYIWWISLAATPKEKFEESAMDFINALQVIRVFRIIRLMKYSRGLWVLIYTIKVSLGEICLTFIFVGIGVLIFGSLIHFAENKKHFPDIPTGFWWAIVTMTTVGYGDKFPRTPIGFVIGSFCTVCGVIVIALTVPVVVSNFLLFYQHGKSLTEIPIEPVCKSSSSRVVNVTCQSTTTTTRLPAETDDRH